MPAISQEALCALVTERDPGLVRVLERIVEHPHREIVVDTPLVELDELTEPYTEGFLDLITSPGKMSPARYEPIHFTYEQRLFQFTHVYDARSRVTFDTYPNRFVRHFLLRFRDTLSRREEELTCAASELARRIDGLFQASFLKDVNPVHHISAEHNVLRKDPNYREILRLHIGLARLHTTG